MSAQKSARLARPPVPPLPEAPVEIGDSARDAEQACDYACRLERAGHPDAAEAAYRRALTLNGRHYRAHFLYSHLLLGQRRYVEAEDEAAAALKLNLNEHAHKHLVDVLSHHAFALASHENPAAIDFDALCEIGDKLTRLNALEAAESILRFPLDLGCPHRAAVLLTRLLIAAGRLREAEGVSEQLRAVQPDTAWAALCDGFIAASRDEGETAGVHLLDGLTRGARCNEAIDQLIAFAESHTGLAARTEAFAALAKACGGEDARVSRALAQCLHRVGDHAGAVALCEHLARQGESRPDALDMPINLDEGALDYVDAQCRDELERGERSGPLYDLLEAPERIGTTLAINFWGRSGSFMLSSMFDGHPRVLQVLPAHSMINVVDSVLGDFCNHGSITVLVNNVLSRFASHTWGGTWDALPEARAGVFAEAMRHGFARLQARGYLNPAMAFRVIHIAHAIAAGLEVEADPIIVYQSHNGMQHKRRRLDELVPGVRFVTCVRFPERTYDSHVHLHYHDMPLGDPFYVGNMLFQWLLEMGEEIPDIDVPGRSLAVRFEDLHQATELVMRSLCTWLDLPWHPCLLESTEGGRAWSMTSKRAASGGANSGTRRLGARDFRTAMSFWWDRWKLRLVLSENYREWGYESPRRALVPAGAAAWLTRTLLFALPAKMHWIACKDAARTVGWPQALRRLLEAHRGMRLLLRQELARRQAQPPHLLKLAYPLESIPEDVRWPHEAA